MNYKVKNSEKKHCQIAKVLRKAGIYRVESNLAEGQKIVLPAGLMATLFGEELLKKLREKK